MEGMAKMKSALPWGTVVLFGALFLVAWWIEDCLIYSVAWSELAPVRFAITAADSLGLIFLAHLVGQSIWFVGHIVAVLISFIVEAIVAGFDAIPTDLRETLPFRLAARAGNSIVATYGGDAIGGLGATLANGVGWLLRLLIALNGAGWLYNLLRRSARHLEQVIEAPLRFFSERSEHEAQEEIAERFAPPDLSPLSPRTPGGLSKRRSECIQFFDSQVQSIGIVLGGGGAKGAYQAGALKAIYEFLQGYNALGKVKMITGTAAGAWNAMFWLAGMMEPVAQGSPDIERWWKSISFGGLIDFPWFHLPFWSNSLLRVTPWRETFFELFGRRLEHLFAEDPPIHFYFTRSDVSAGVTSYVTNWPGISRRVDELGLDKDDKYRFFDVVDAGETAAVRVADAIFSSMSLPPLCATAQAHGALYEEGTAGESLPLRFAIPLEKCDLVFVLPVDGGHGWDRVGRPIFSRMLRFMDSRKDALGHWVLRNAELINRFCERMERIEFGIRTLAPEIRGEGLAAEALAGLHEEVAEFNHEYRRLYMFTIAPSGRLELGDFGLWQRRAAENAFDLMYVQTRRELATRFFEDIELEDGRVVMVDGIAPTGDELPRPQYRRPSQW